MHLPGQPPLSLIELVRDWWQDAPLLVEDVEPADRQLELPEGTVVTAVDGTDVPIAAVNGSVGFTLVDVAPIVIDGREVVAFVAHDLFGDRRFTIDAQGRVHQADVHLQVSPAEAPDEASAPD